MKKYQRRIDVTNSGIKYQGYTKDGFYFKETTSMWCWKQESKGIIHEAKSIEILNKIDLSKEENPVVYYYKSLNLVLLKDWKNAIKSFDVLLEKYPNNPEISNFVGYTLVDRNIRLKEGIELIKNAVSQEPQNGFYLDSLGWAYYKLNDFKKAIIYLERAIELEPQEMEITDHLGDAYFKTGRQKEAKLVWERALSLHGGKDLSENIRKKLSKNFNYNK